MDKNCVYATCQLFSLCQQTPQLPGYQTQTLLRSKSFEHPCKSDHIVKNKIIFRNVLK